MAVMVVVAVVQGGKRGWVGTCAPGCWDDDDARGCARRVVPVRVPGELAILEAFGGAASGGVSGCVLAMHPRRHDCDSEAANQHDDRDTDNRDRDEYLQQRVATFVAPVPATRDRRHPPVTVPPDIEI